MRRSTVLQKELEEIQSNPSDDYKCLALPSDPYDLQFAIRGPKGTDLEGGIFHGRMLFSKEYPDIIPSIMFLTNFYLFGTHTEINFSHNLYKSFTVHRLFLGLIEFLRTYPDGALGSVGYNKKKRRASAIKSREATTIFHLGSVGYNKRKRKRRALAIKSCKAAPIFHLSSVRYNKKKRRALAIKSRKAPPIFGTSERQKLINEIHDYMLSKTPPPPSNRGRDIQASYQNDLDKTMGGIYIVVGNTINANNSKHVGIHDF
ncbi:hypothetical protein ACE6H2_016459 [Prunus campanulata]